MSQSAIVVTGAHGQLGKAIQSLALQYPQFRLIFLSKDELAIQDEKQVHAYFSKIKPAYCINCAAYTAVDKAETEKDVAMLINATAVGILAEACNVAGTKFIHISTDYVFDGTAASPYKEDSVVHPVNFYGETKLMGEKACFTNNPASIVIRTSWVYAEYGNNFVKTMVRLMKERATLNVVNDQLGSPTYAVDLATTILDIIAACQLSAAEKWLPGIYHYSNEGIISWYDFAVAIKELTGSSCVVSPIPTSMFPTAASRPAYSVMDKEKIKKLYAVSVPAWRDSLKTCIARLV